MTITLLLFHEHIASTDQSMLTQNYSVIICCFGYPAFALRVYTRLRYAPWGMEDWCIAVA
jgi:hypothetical protein